MKNKRLLRIRDLKTQFDTEEGRITAVDKVSFSVDRGQTFALVGESGCGKSVTAFSIMQLIPSPPGRIVSGRIDLDGHNLLELPEREMRNIRGSQISMVFQEPMTSLNPVFTCGNQIVEAVRLHHRVGRDTAKQMAVDMLAKVGIPDPGQRFNEYPHQLSGGMRQRVMIAMALSCNPKLLIADEPTTALDVTIQAQILDLLNELQQSEGLSILLITHDLGVVATVADGVGVMYASKLVEVASAEDLFLGPKHPYTEGLFRSVPRLGEKRHRLETIQGSVPDPLWYPSGCRFHPRCQLTRQLAEKTGEGVRVHDVAAENIRVLERCREQEPELREINEGHWCACWECLNYAGAPITDLSGFSI